MKVKITGMPVRIGDKRYNRGDIIEVTDDIYKTIKSICIIVEESENKKVESDETEDKNIEIDNNDIEYKKMTKDDIMIELAGKGIEFNPSLSKKELYEILINLEVSEDE